MAPAAITLTSLTFETDVPAWFSFAQVGANIATIQVISGAGGTDGIASRIVANPGTFAGGGLGSATGPINLATAGITPGNVTVAAIDNIRVKFDVNIPVGQSINIRLEPGNAGFDQRVDLGTVIAGTGSFQTINLDASLGAPAQKTTLTGSMNTANATGLKFVYSINNQDLVPAGTNFVFDNLEITYVPEPSSAMVLTLTGLASLARRRRNRAAG